MKLIDGNEIQKTKGGCATGSQLAAALALGACGINMGTRFMATKEAPIHVNVKRALVEGTIESTRVIMKTMRNAERVFDNEDARKVSEIEDKHPGDFSKIAHLMKGEEYRKVFHETGEVNKGVWSAGVCMALIDDVPSCEELIERIVKEAVETIDGRLRKCVVVR